MVETDKNTSVQRDVKRTKQQPKITDNTLIKVKNGVFGRLIFVSRRNGNTIRWDTQGDIQYVTFSELLEIRNQSIGFYKDQMLIVLGIAEQDECKATVEDIYNALGVREFYKNFIDITDFHTVCGWDISEIPERIAMLSPAVKQNLIVAINQFIKDGTLDSRKKIRAFATALNCEFDEEG